MAIDLRALRLAAEDFFETEVLSVRFMKDVKHTKVYIFELDTSPDADLPSEVIVRIFKRPRLQQSVDSEVATMNFLAAHTRVPVARVFFHESVRNNPVGAQYIFEERLYGEPLKKALDEDDEPEYELSLDAWHNLVEDYADIVSQLFQLRFDRIGALYEASVGSDQDSDYSEVETYVGPTAESWFYRGRRSALEHLDVGPWESSSDWLAGLISNEIRYLRTFPTELDKELQDELGGDPLDLNVDWALNDAEDRLRRLISLCNLGSGELGPDEDLVRVSRTFGLFHAHLLPHNILIDTRTGKIKGITGWEDATITPIWRIASVPYWLEWPGPDSEWNRRPREGKDGEDVKSLDGPLALTKDDGRRNGVTEEELAELRLLFREKVTFEDPENLFVRCLEENFFDQIKIIPHLLYNIWEREQVELSIQELEEWEAVTFQ
ncbi:hypothetical protein FRB99_007530 [Tulasnella sp. 403]|nr:hypothetical protein FRB99_007530 [Tulasnella sp. 403]